MKIKALTFYSKVLSLFMVLIGFSSCNKNNPFDPEEPRLEYGTPSAKYKIKGVVKSSVSKKGIKDIKIVGVRTVENKELEISKPVSTNTDGSFTLEIQSFPEKNVKFEVKFEDIDGEANNGLFDTKTQTVEFKNADFTNGSGWDKGETETNMNTVEIKPTKKD